MARIDAIFEAIKGGGASDLHIAAGSRPMLRVNGEIEPIENEELSPEVAKNLLLELLTQEQREQFERDRAIEFSYEVPSVARLRCSLYLQAHGIAGAFRVLPSTILGVDELGLPKQILSFCRLRKGLVLVTGPPGSGKSTTLAALIEHINENQSRKILTLEDPIEYIFRNKRSLIQQREIGSHAKSFPEGLRDSARADVDVLVVGEMRDAETIAQAITAAESRQLVFATMHTLNTTQSVERITDSFTGERQHQVRMMLSECLRGVISQRLLRRQDGAGRVAAVEILVGTTAVRALVRDRKPFQLAGVIQSSRNLGMQLMDEHLVELAHKGLVTADEAFRVVSNYQGVRRRLGLDGPRFAPAA